MPRPGWPAVWTFALSLGWAAAFASADEAVPRPEHPAPIAVRPHWAVLNGTWQFAFDPKDEGLDAEWFRADADKFDRTIVVPFAWESPLAKAGERPEGEPIGWYRRTFRVPEGFPEDQRVWLRFGAVDNRADVWVNGEKVADHWGGYTPFEADITDALRRDEENVVVVRAYDPTDPSHPTGKQVGWYTPVSGIWQTVWLEARPKARIDDFLISTEIDPARGTIDARVIGIPVGKNYSMSVRSEDPTVAPATNTAIVLGNADDEFHRFILKADVREPKLWTPETPHLYDITLELKDEDGRVIDTVQTYFGLRTIARGKLPGEDFERILLNGKPIYLRGALDQSYNPEGLYTGPTDEFLKRDIELAKESGFNFLRIHIKSEEPRRLYWADRLGMLIMQDMPNTWRQDATARRSWEKAMRETVLRDRNHPSIFSWVAFNETWGLGSPQGFKQDTDTQDWARKMVAEIRKLDPTRLVEDHSPCNYDHFDDTTDFNSWHFYIDDHEAARRHIEDVVARSHEGSDFNYVPGVKMNSAPLINSEYASVSAGGGDRDISWGFRDLTNLQRMHDKIQGYIYTELTDIEWEHNGFANYDRSPKVFGYDAFVPGMTPADLQGADYVGYDGPPVVVAEVGDLIPIEPFVSHYSEREGEPTIRWWVAGVNADGEASAMEPVTRPAQWEPYRVTKQKRLSFRIHEPFVGAVALVLQDAEGRRIAANFVNVVVRTKEPLPRVERLDGHHVAVRFSPEEIATARWSGGYATPEGKVHGQGSGSFVYKLKLPEAVAKSKPTSVRLRMELASKAGREKVDWPERVNAQDYPQTDGRKHPSAVALVLNGRRVAGIALPDDPADSRGVLSHVKAFEHGSHGKLIDVEHPLPETAVADLAAGRPLILRLTTDDSGGPAGGLAIFGAETGAYPLDPTLIFETEDELPEALEASDSIAVETLVSRRSVALATGEAGIEAATWAYTTDEPGEGWQAADFDDSGWSRGKAGFGTRGTPGVRVNTRWNSPRIWLRTEIDLPDLAEDDGLTLRLFHDEDVVIYVNGERLLTADGYITSYREIPLSADQKALFRAGKNVIAVSCRQTDGGQGIDLGLVRTEGGE